jgi:hypothetical protein
VGDVKRLIEMHWFDGLPLWGCFTGLRGQEGEEEDWDIRIPNSDNEDSGKPLTAWAPIGIAQSREDFEKWMYAVRQIVALYRIDMPKWRSLSLEYLHIYNAFSGSHANMFQGKDSNVDLVEGVIDAVITTIEYHLGHNGDSEDGFANGYFRFSSGLMDGCEFRKTAGKREYACVDLVNKYCGKIDQALRVALGEEAYDEWEKSEDEKTVPKGLLF